jgi:hypothetical protein
MLQNRYAHHAYPRAGTPATRVSRKHQATELSDKLLFRECGSCRRMIQNTDPLHQLESRERVGADARRYPFQWMADTGYW